MTLHYKQVLRYWTASNNPQPEELDVTKRRLRLDGPILELLKDDNTVEQKFGLGQTPYDCWLLELRTTAEEKGPLPG